MASSTSRRSSSEAADVFFCPGERSKIQETATTDYSPSYSESIVVAGPPEFLYGIVTV